MSRVIFPKKEQRVYIPTGPGALQRALKLYGRLPPVAIVVVPVDKSPQFYLDRFIQYNFKSSILIPVDTFSFTFLLDESTVQTVPVKEGDLIYLKANEIILSTGIVDTVQVETDANSGSTVTISGRDMLSQFEDQDAVSLNSAPVYGTKLTVSNVIRILAADTKIPKEPVLFSAPKNAYLFATQPGESKLSALQRYCEGLNILFWGNPDGSVAVGKPNMFQNPPSGRLFLKKGSRSTGASNVLSMRSTRSSTQIPNAIVPIWNGQETVQNLIGKEQVIYNSSRGPARLRKYGHIVPKAVVISTPEGASPQDFSELNFLNTAGSANLLQAYAKREIARANINELKVEVQVVGHYNENAIPFAHNQVYRIQYDLDGIDEDMFLYEVDYSFNGDKSQITNLYFCRQNCLVSDLKAL